MSDLALSLSGVSKMYKIFPTRTANLADAIGLPGRRRYREFWALRGVNLELPHGERLGIIGRNGAGKSTLLKLITANLAPTEGTVRVSGSVQALLEAGAGFHPEFTGAENIRASLTLQGMPASDMDAAIEEIADFTELGPFLAQPFRTYSAGMQARLSFATATAIRPEILIVDEMLSAGDAYFSNKANERMRRLVDSGASLLLVSHSLDHVTMFCEQAIWIDRGRIIKAGGSLEVVKAYQQFTRVLEERRLKAKNAKARKGETPTFALDNYAETVYTRLTVTGEGAWVDVERAELRRETEVEETVLVGDAQDADEGHAAFVVVTGGDEGWSGPNESGAGLGFSRRLTAGAETAGVGEIAFNLYSFYPDRQYSVEVSVRGEGFLSIEFIREGRSLEVLKTELGRDWRSLTLEAAPHVHAVGSAVTEADYSLPAKLARRPKRSPQPGADTITAAETAERRMAREENATHWPGEGSLEIEGVTLFGPSGEAAVFEVGSPLSLVMSFVAQRSGTFAVIPAAVLYRRDGVLLSSHVGDPFEITLDEQEGASVRLDLKRLNLGDGHFVFSVALYRELSFLGKSEAYDLVDRSYEFEVVGNPPGDGSLFHHPAEWQLP